MSAIELRQSFRRRFRAVARQIWSLHVGRGVARTVLVATVLVAATATADYFFELSWVVRAALLAVKQPVPDMALRSLHAPLQVPLQA